MNNEIFESVDHYISNLLGHEDEALIAATKSLERSRHACHQHFSQPGQIFTLPCLLCNAKNILELGTLAGYSTIWMARALPKEGKLITLEYDPKHAAVAQKNIERAGLAGQVQIKTGKALDILPQLHAEGAGPFDMIFIDADKPPYADYFQWALRLSRTGTLIVADNVIRDGKVLDENSTEAAVNGAQRFNKMLGANTAVTATILANGGRKRI